VEIFSESFSTSLPTNPTTWSPSSKSTKELDQIGKMKESAFCVQSLTKWTWLLPCWIFIYFWEPKNDSFVHNSCYIIDPWRSSQILQALLGLKTYKRFKWGWMLSTT
jgi:hypothetical protein